MSFLRGALKSSEKTSSVLIVLIVFVSLLLAGESSYGTPLMRTSEILQFQVGGFVLNWASVCASIKLNLKWKNSFDYRLKNVQPRKGFPHLMTTQKFAKLFKTKWAAVRDQKTLMINCVNINGEDFLAIILTI